jgi:hypothetical protein
MQRLPPSREHQIPAGQIQEGEIHIQDITRRDKLDIGLRLPGQRFERLIDPSVQALLQSPDDEFENISISFAGSLMEA